MLSRVSQPKVVRGWKSREAGSQQNKSICEEWFASYSLFGDVCSIPLWDIMSPSVEHNESERMHKHTVRTISQLGVTDKLFHKQSKPAIDTNVLFQAGD